MEIFSSVFVLVTVLFSFVLKYTISGVKGQSQL